MGRACLCTRVLSREDIFDLLRPGSGPLNIREDIRKGVYVEGLCEKVVEDGEHLANSRSHGRGHTSNCSLNVTRLQTTCSSTACTSRATTSEDVTNQPAVPNAQLTYLFAPATAALTLSLVLRSVRRA